MIIEHHAFTDLPLRATGNVQVASVTGWVLWHLRDNGGSMELTHITEMWLHAKGGGEVTLLDDQPLFQAVRAELEREARSLSNRRGELPPMSPTPYKSAISPDLDSAAVEGAQQPSNPG